MKPFSLSSLTTIASKYGYVVPSRKNLDEHSGGVVVLLVMVLVAASVIVIKWTMFKEGAPKKQTVRGDLFDENGGNLLQSRIRIKNRYRIRYKYRNRNNLVSLSVYSADEMNSITNNYQSLYPKRSLGSCHFKLFKGTLPDEEETEVLVVEITKVAQPHLKKFVDQLIFLSKPHPNVQRVLGCCLDKLSPLIVYELHGEGSGTLSDGYPRSNEERLRVATGVASGLAYLNSRKCSKSTFVHGDICTSTVLVDASYNAKIFYAPGSNLITRDSSSTTATVDENYKCRDPAYIRSGKLKKKSDVYSFGVVLNELLERGRMTLDWYVHVAHTGREPQNVERGIRRIVEEDDHNMMMEFVTCLKAKPSRRPSMKKVEVKLRALMI